MEKKKDVIVNLSYNPSFSGYGGFDEWTMEDMTYEEMDKFVEKLNNLCESFRKECFTGAQ